GREAVALLEPALPRIQARCGPDGTNTLGLLSHVAAAYWVAGQRDKTLLTLEDAVTRRKAKFGLDHPETLSLLINLAQACQAAGQLDRQERALRQLLEGTRKKDGPEATSTTDALGFLGLNLLRRQKYAEAEPLLRECLTFRKQKLPDHPATFDA